MLQAQTHGYVLFIVTEGVSFNKQRYFKLSSEFFDAQSSLLSVLQSHIPVETIMHVTFDPGTCAHLASHAATCSSLACNKGDYSWFLQSEERIQEASGYCEIAQVSFVYIAMQTVQRHSPVSFLEH